MNSEYKLIESFAHSEDCPCCNARRNFLKTTLIATSGLMLPIEWANAARTRQREIKLRNPNTGENMQSIYWTPDYGYIHESIAEISAFFRDFRQDLVKPVEVKLLNILHYIQTNVDGRYLNLLSGYRSPRTNKMLRSRSSNVAKSSFHMQAMAADISVQGYTGRQLAGIARQLSGGGIGTGSTFIHVDCGNVREWKY